MGVHNYRGHVYMSSLASLKSHWSSCGKTSKKLNTTPVPLGTKEGALCTYLANKTNRAYARLEVYARLPGVKPQNVHDWSLLREHTHTHTHTHMLTNAILWGTTLWGIFCQHFIYSVGCVDICTLMGVLCKTIIFIVGYMCARWCV